MPPQSDSYSFESSRKTSDLLKTPADALRHSGSVETANNPKPLSVEQRTSATRSTASYQASQSFISNENRRRSPARTRPLLEQNLANGIRVSDPNVRVTDASKGGTRSKSPYIARSYQSTGSPYLAPVYAAPSQRTVSTKGRSVSRERASTGKVGVVTQGKLAANPHVSASEPTSPTGAVGSSLRRMASLRKPGEGKGYLDRLSDQLANGMRVQTADPSSARAPALRGLESGYGTKLQTGFATSGGPGQATSAAVGSASRTLTLERGDVSDRVGGQNQGESTVLNRNSNQDRVSVTSIGNQSIAQQRLRGVAEPMQQREESMSGKRPVSAAFGSQRTDVYTGGKQGPIGAKAERRKQSGLDSFAEISVSVGELLRNQGADVSRWGREPIRPKVTDVTPASGPLLSAKNEAGLHQGAHRRSPVGGEGSLENAGGSNTESWKKLPSRSERDDASPLSSPSTSAGTPESHQNSSSRTAGSDRHAKGGVNALREGGESTRRGFQQTAGQVPVSGGLGGSKLSSETWGRFERGQRAVGGVCTADISDDVSSEKSAEVRNELTLDDISLSSSSGESDPESEAEEAFDPRGGRGLRSDISSRGRENNSTAVSRGSADINGDVSRARVDVSGRARADVSRVRSDVSRRGADVSNRGIADVSIRIRDDVSSDASSSPDRSEIRSPDSFGSESPRDLLTPDSLLARRPVSSNKQTSWGGLDFRIDPPPVNINAPSRQRSARIVPLCDVFIPRPTVGLRNLGNTCFLNSILQCLISTPPLLAALVALQDVALQQAVDCEDAPGGSSTGRGGSPRPRLVGPLVRLLRAMTGARPFSALSPEEFLGRLERWATQFADGHQHDSQEALRIIMEALDMDCSRVKVPPTYRELASTGAPPGKLAGDAWTYHRSRHDSVIQDIFSGQLQSTVECRDCGLQSHCFDPFLDLSLPLPKPSKAAASERDAGSWFSPGRSVSLQQCLAAFTAEEDLEEDHSCERCKVPRPATKKLAIFQLPRVLVLHIKRISGARFSLFSKDSTAVDFPLTGLDVRTSVSKDASPGQATDSVYDLVAVSNHSGSMTGGHYTAYCKETASPGARWHCYNDSSVSEIASSQVVSSSAYVLFYQKRGNPS